MSFSELDQVILKSVSNHRRSWIGKAVMRKKNKPRGIMLLNFRLYYKAIMSTFTLAVSCLTTSNLPWFMDLTFQVPMQYCSLQHRTLLLSPVTSTAGYCICFGSIPSFFLELFLHWSPVAYWAPINLGSSSFLPFHTLHGVLEARILKWFAISFSSGPHSVRPLHHDLPVLGGSTGMA